MSLNTFCNHFLDAFRATLMHNLKSIDSDLPTVKVENHAKTLLYGNQIYDEKKNQIILMHLIRHIKDSQGLMNLFLTCLKQLQISYRCF